MIQIKQVNFAYKKPKQIFTNLNIKFQSGSIYGLLGKNGSGKTTLMKLIAGLRYPQGGNITIDKNNSYGRHPNYLSKLFLIPEEFDFPAIDIESYVKIHSPFYKNFDNAQFEYYLNEFKVPIDSKITLLSFGQKKKFLLSFALACNTDVLIMDEPTNGLDIPSKHQFRKILAASINEKKLFIISTHQIKDIEEIIDNLSIIDEGQMRFSADVNSIMDKLSFVNSADINRDNFEILFEEKKFGGSKIICKNRGDVFTQIDLELLFNAIINNSDGLSDLFKNKNEDNASI